MTGVASRARRARYSKMVRFKIMRSGGKNVLTVMGFASLPARIRSPQILKISRLIGSKKSSAATRSLIAAKADLERVSTRDFQRYDDNGVNWRVIDGYGAVIAAHGEGLPVVFGSPARHIDHSGRRLRVDIRTGRSLPMPPSSRYR